MARLPSLPFTASRLQVATYLFGVALFSISFLVFLNSAVSFVITDLIGQRKHVGDAVGTLGFADELLALIACPAWGLLSDRIGVRNVTATGYALVALALCVFVQARDVYPQLLLARLLFSTGGSATSTMVTAILPTMTLDQSSSSSRGSAAVEAAHETRPGSNSISATGTDATLTQADYDDRHAARAHAPPSRAGTSQIAGLVGMFTGIGALVALGLFLPLPTYLQDTAGSPKTAVTYSFYIVGAVALVVAAICFFGLRGLAGEEAKGWRNLVAAAKSHTLDPSAESAKTLPYIRLASQSVRLGFTDVNIGLGYFGGFVARASSVAISLFIPLYVNAYFISTGRCKEHSSSSPAEIKRECERAYKLAAALTGVTELVALLCAPLFGYLDSKYRRWNLPLLTASAVGIVGYAVLGRLTPDPKAREGSPLIFLVMAILGISQIGAIVCSLSVLGRGTQGSENAAPRYVERRGAGVDLHDDDNHENELQETAPLLSSAGLPDPRAQQTTRNHLKGSIAGVYSLAGGAGILILTKLGGYLFDAVSPGAPFVMMAIANGLLLVVGLGCAIASEYGARQRPAVAD